MPFNGRRRVQRSTLGDRRPAYSAKTHRGRFGRALSHCIRQRITLELSLRRKEILRHGTCGASRCRRQCRPGRDPAKPTHRVRANTTGWARKPPAPWVGTHLELRRRTGRSWTSRTTLKHLRPKNALQFKPEVEGQVCASIDERATRRDSAGRAWSCGYCAKAMVVDAV
jgi:hypothetical protein